MRGEDASTTYIEPRNIEILFKLAEVRTKRDQVSHPEYLKPLSAAYSESKTPELKTSFAMTVPKGLDVLSAVRRNASNKLACLGTLEYARIISSEVAWNSNSAPSFPAAKQNHEKIAVSRAHGTHLPN
jgi:hypothetical protein